MIWLTLYPVAPCTGCHSNSTPKRSTSLTLKPAGADFGTEEETCKVSNQKTGETISGTYPKASQITLPLKTFPK